MSTSERNRLSLDARFALLNRYSERNAVCILMAAFGFYPHLTRRLGRPLAGAGPSFKPTPARKHVLIVAPRYTNPIFPQSMAFHSSTFQYIWMPNGCTDQRCPISAMSRPKSRVCQTFGSDVTRSTSASFIANKK